MGAEPLLELLADPRVVLGGTSAARVLSWELTDGSWPVEAYVAEPHLVALMEQYGLERDDRSAELVLRSVQEPWPLSASGPSDAGRGRRARSGRSRRRPAG